MFTSAGITFRLFGVLAFIESRFTNVVNFTQLFSKRLGLTVWRGHRIFQKVVHFRECLVLVTWRPYDQTTMVVSGLDP